ncbi:hypothetical protein ACFU5O_21655 [Streptomyces sp. NPDC057445]|uniref:hypothetical protein n=1 Tax=Streptomyces sp. NPDC057445 TaxID=3346136 RepID=UPI00369A92DF
MGSLRNPVGPLPSSIYWRRRAVALSLLALLALLIAWAVGTGGGGGSKGGDDGKPGGAGPAPSITPGDDPSGPAISEQPGGRDESDETDGPGGSDGTGDDGGTEGSDGAGKNGDPGASGAANGGGSVGRQVPAGSPLPNCSSGTLQLTLRSAKVSYAPDEKPRFQLIAKNTSTVACKADFGPKAAVLVISDNEDDEVWSSKDCPRGGGSLLLEVPANSTITHTVDWDRRPSAARCATPPAAQAPAGTYLVEATFPGVTVTPASFRLDKD